MKKIFLLFIAFGLALMASARPRVAVGFYNLENLFDTIHDEGKNDADFLPAGRYGWTSMKYEHKLANMAKVLAEMGTDYMPDGCAVIGVAEVENERCLTNLCAQAPLRQRGYQFAHVEGPDRRGIDCALLYNPKYFKMQTVELLPYVSKDTADADFTTRGFLLVTGKLLRERTTFIVCHLPSRGKTAKYRNMGAERIRAIKDSLQAANKKLNIIVMGDMNDDPADESMTRYLGGVASREAVCDTTLWNPWTNVLAAGEGTLLYRGKWNLFDQILLSGSLLDKKGLKYYNHMIFRRDYLIQQDGKFKGSMLRTHAGGRWLDGYSDHLPTIVCFE